jgi:hypothetical protein
MEEGENCELVIQLPDGSQHSHSFKLGATVAYVKLQVQQLYGVPMEKQHMQTGGKTLIDPCKHRLADGLQLLWHVCCLIVSQADCRDPGAVWRTAQH